MKVILIERVDNLGHIGDEVNVRPGYARNFLLPRKKALRWSKENLARFETQRKEIEARNLERRQDAEKVAKTLTGASCTIIRQAGETGHLYGSVSARDIADGLAVSGFHVDRQQVVLNRPIKTLGVHEVKIALHPDVAVTVTVNVARSSAEAAEQEATSFFESEEVAREALAEEGAGEAAAEETA